MSTFIPLVILLVNIAISPVNAAVIEKQENTNTQVIKRGDMIYQRFCSLCHGKNLEGEPRWHLPKADGKMPAPPHNEKGHTWHHADIVLFNITKYGLVPPYAPEGYKSDMPGWQGTLSDDDIRAVLAFIKSRWPEEIRQHQEEINNNYSP